MQVVTNTGFVKSRSRLGKLATLGGFLCLVGGMALVWFTPSDPTSISPFVWLAYATLLPGFLLIQYGKYNTVRWGLKPRVDEALTAALKTLDYKYQLFNYGNNLPVDNLLLTPSGVLALEVRPLFGEFINKGMRWSRKRGLGSFFMALSDGGLGNPSRDAQRAGQNVRRFLVEQLGEELASQVPVAEVVVFTHPRAIITIEEPAVPVAPIKDVKNVIRQIPWRQKLDPALYRKVTMTLRRVSGAPQSA